MSNQFQQNELIGDYQIDGFLGAGGMGEVYLGVHTRLNRAAAIKVLNTSAFNSSLSARFQNEARLQSSLHHPNIATLYDFKEIDGKMFIFMEFVNGESLEDLVEKRFFTVAESLKIFHSIVGAVSFVHSNGVVHRDIKSQNIKLTSDGVPKLLDFGIAKDAQSSNLTRTGGVIGTPNYIAPEQLSGSQASAQTDVWALGILLYELLTGVKPFEAETIGELCEKIKYAQFLPVENYNQAAPKEISHVVHKCLEREPARRYESAEALAYETAYILKTQYGISTAAPVRLRSLSGHSENDDYSFDKDVPNIGNSGGSRIYKILAAGSAVVVLLIFGLFGVWAISGSDESGDNKNGEIIGENLLPQANSDKDDAIIKPQLQSSPIGEIGNKLQIDTIGGSADVIQGGVVVGKTPYELSAEDGDIISLTLRREGYEDKDIQIEVGSGKRVYTFTLQQK